MAKHGDFFPENPQNVDELIDALAQRAAAAQRMLNSMTREQRDELMALSQQAFGSPALMEQLAQLDAKLQALRPGEDWSGSERFDGEQPLGLGDGTGVLQDLADLDALAEQLSQSYGRADGRHRPRHARPPARRRGRGRRPHPPASWSRRCATAATSSAPATASSSCRPRRCASSASRCCATSPTGCRAARASATSARPAPPASAPGPPGLGVRRHRALGRPAHRAERRPQRGSSEPRPRLVTNASSAEMAFGPSHRRLHVDDVEITETEARTQAGVALLVDTSCSMALDGRWVPMKRTALALHKLISHPVPRRRPAADHVRPARPDDGHRASSSALEARWDKGTNLHHALLLANRHFRKHPNAQPVLLIVTDGEPTSHLEPDGEAYFEYPPHPRPSRTPSASWTTPAGSARRRRSSGSATTRAWRGSSTPWPAASTAGWSRPSSTTWAPPSWASYLGSRGRRSTSASSRCRSAGRRAGGR